MYSPVDSPQFDNCTPSSASFCYICHITSLIIHTAVFKSVLQCPPLPKNVFKLLLLCLFYQAASPEYFEFITCIFNEIISKCSSRDVICHGGSVEYLCMETIVRNGNCWILSLTGSISVGITSVVSWYYSVYLCRKLKPLRLLLLCVF
jgi:hypothetical protein